MNVFLNNERLNFAQSNHQPILSVESSLILQKFKEINANNSFSPDAALLKELKLIDPMELKRVLRCFFIEMLQQDRIHSPAKFLEGLASVIPLVKMQHDQMHSIEDKLKEAKEMVEEAKLYLEATYGNITQNIKSHISTILDGILSVIESIVTAFGLGDFFKSDESDKNADNKSRTIMTLLGLSSFIATIILPVLGPALGSVVIIEILLSIAALSIVWPLIKPKTTHLPINAENWTKYVENVGFLPQGRKETLDEIANIITTNRHPFLLSRSSAGRSHTAKAFAQAIKRGEYPELKNKYVFRLNAMDILDHTPSSIKEGSSVLNKISGAMGRHSDDIILVLDNIHLIFKNNQKIADQLKAFLEESGEFPHLIGMTTESDFHTHVKQNNAFSLRFDLVNIENTSRDETLKILGETLLKSPSKPLIKEGALDYIYNKSRENENASQPVASLNLLKRCINAIEKTQRTATEKKVIEVSNKILSLRFQTAASRSRKKDVRGVIEDLEKQMSELQEILRKEQKELDLLVKAKDLLDQVTKETYLSILKISIAAQKTMTPQTEQELKLFLLLHQFLGPSLEDYITEKSKDIGVKVIIDNALIEHELEQTLPAIKI